MVIISRAVPFHGWNYYQKNTPKAMLIHTRSVTAGYRPSFDPAIPNAGCTEFVMTLWLKSDPFVDCCCNNTNSL